MSNGADPQSAAPYIIICSGRTDELVAQTVALKVCAASRCAAQLVSHIVLQHPGEVTPADTKAISDLQHSMMDNIAKMTKKVAAAKCAEMFKLLYELEKKFP